MSDPTSVSRRLVAVFAADVEGYSRLMGADEVGTLKGLTERRAILDRLIGEHRGRIANTAGDSILAEFGSAVEAVQCAVEAQTALAEANANVAPDRRISFRIGIHIGDVMVRAGDLFGDGVNIAARLQSIAKPGGVCISGATYDQVRKVLPMTFVDLGAQRVKNIEEPIRAFAVSPLMRSVAPDEGPRTILLDATKPPLLPKKPSIAVLPFQNMSGDPEQEYFADGMVEEIITALSRFASLSVIARNSSFAYKGKAVDIKRVGSELGVRYVLEGSVRKAAGRVRVTGQLIEAETGVHLWANKFDGSLGSIFELQDSVATEVVGAIVPQLFLADAELVARKPADSWDSYDHYLRGLALMHLRTPEGTSNAQVEFETAMALDPNFALAQVYAAFCLHNRYWANQPITPDEQSRAIRLAASAIDLAPDDATVLGIAAYVVGNLADEVERGLALADRAIAINCNFAHAWAIKGYLTVLVGDIAGARHALNEAIRLNPLDVGNIVRVARSHMAACMALGEHEEYASWARKLLAVSPTDVHGLVALLGHAVRHGNGVEANKMLALIQKLYPQLRKSHLRPMYLRYRKPEHQTAIFELLSEDTGLAE